MHEGASSWVDFAYHTLEWLQGWGKWQLGAFFVWAGVVLIGHKHGWPWQKRKKADDEG